MAASTKFSAALVRRAQNGSKKARRQLVHQLEPLLRAYFIKRLGKNTVVDDLVQNTLLRMHRGLEDLQQPERFKAFVMKAAMFELQDYYRGRYKMREQLYEPDTVLHDKGSAKDTGLAVDLERALATLTPTSRRVLELREYGYRYQEIGEMLDLTEAAVKMRVKRAFKQLRQLFASSSTLLILGGAVTLWAVSAAILVLHRIS